MIKSLFPVVALAIFVLLQSSNCYGQHKESYETISELDEKYVAEKNYLQLYNELEGTFQFQYTIAGMRPLIEKSILAKVASERLENENVYLPISENVTVFIPSFNVINSPGFVPLATEKYVGMGNSVLENQ